MLLKIVMNSLSNYLIVINVMLQEEARLSTGHCAVSYLVLFFPFFSMTKNPEIIRAMQEAYAETGSLRKVCQQFNCSPNTVKKYAMMVMPVKEHHVVREIKSNDQRLIGLYVGLWMGDGTQYVEKRNSYVVKICCNHDDICLNAFIQDVSLQLFGKNSHYLLDASEQSPKRAVIKFHSRYIYDFVFRYIDYDRGGRKTHSVRLKQQVSSYSADFLEGCLLGLVLSDGYLKRVFSFNVTSELLATNCMEMLRYFGFQPSLYIYRPKGQPRKDLHMVKLRVAESKRLERQLDLALEKLKSSYCFQQLKYGKSEPARI
jgi:hypothetical protein